MLQRMALPLSSPLFLSTASALLAPTRSASLSSSTLTFSERMTLLHSSQHPHPQTLTDTHCHPSFAAPDVPPAPVSFPFFAFAASPADWPALQKCLQSSSSSPVLGVGLGVHPFYAEEALSPPNLSSLLSRLEPFLPPLFFSSDFVPPEESPSSSKPDPMLSHVPFLSSIGVALADASLLASSEFSAAPSPPPSSSDNPYLDWPVHLSRVIHSHVLTAPRPTSSSSPVLLIGEIGLHQPSWKRAARASSSSASPLPSCLPTSRGARLTSLLSSPDGPRHKQCLLFSLQYALCCRLSVSCSLHCVHALPLLASLIASVDAVCPPPPSPHTLSSRRALSFHSFKEFGSARHLILSLEASINNRERGSASSGATAQKKVFFGLGLNAVAVAKASIAERRDDFDDGILEGRLLLESDWCEGGKDGRGREDKLMDALREWGGEEGRSESWHMFEKNARDFRAWCGAGQQGLEEEKQEGEHSPKET